MKSNFAFIFLSNDECPHCMEKSEHIADAINYLLQKGKLEIQDLVETMGELYEVAHSLGKRDALEDIIQYADNKIDEE